MIAPAFERYTRDLLHGEVWRRPGLAPRERSIVTLAVLVSRNQAVALPAELERALDNGVAPGEIAEIVTHLAFYAGWGNALAAWELVDAVFARRGVQAEELPAAEVDLLPLDQAAEERRVATVGQNFGQVASGVLHYTTETLFRDLWLRPGLAPRERSMVTVSALVASGQFAQIAYHLNRAMDNGLGRDEAAEMLTQLAFYAGWPNAFSAMPVFKDVFNTRKENP